VDERPRFQPKNLLVTGGAGFIGANFVHFWLREHSNTRVIVLDALTYAGNLMSLDSLKNHPGYRFVHGNIIDERLVESLLREERIDTIVHFAAESHVDRSIHGPDAFVETNIIGTHSLLKTAKRAWVDDLAAPTSDHRFHHVSTDEVYGSLGPEDPPFHETTPFAPNSPYSASKASSDHLVRAYHHTYGLNVITSNCSNNYGPYQFPEKLIPLVLVNILHGKPLPIYGDGLNVRDWLFVEDHCRGIGACLEKGVPGETYNLGGQAEWTNIEIVRLLCRLMDERLTREPALSRRFPEAPPSRGQESTALISFVKDRPGHDRRYAIDNRKAKKHLAYQPQETFASGIEKTLDWYLANELWWRRVMDGSYREWINTNY